jgi:hypothetical protein
VYRLWNWKKLPRPTGAVEPEKNKKIKMMMVEISGKISKSITSSLT